MDKNRIEGAAKQGERANNRKAFVIKAKWRRSGGCAVKECVLTSRVRHQIPEITDFLAAVPMESIT
jgi:hypothetical protein